MAHINSAYDRTESYRYATKQVYHSPEEVNPSASSTTLDDVTLDKSYIVLHRLKKRIPYKQFWFWLVVVIVVLATIFTIVAVSVNETGSLHANPVTGVPSTWVVLPDHRQDVLTLNLDGKWTVHNKNGSQNHTATVPGNVHTALMQAGVIGDPYYQFNDIHYRWVHADDWTYRKIFVVTGDVIERTTYRLVCHGLDTIATVSINSQLVGRSRNQFVKYVFDISKNLKLGKNVIEIAFESAVTYAKTQFDKHPYKILPTCPPAEYKAECHANMIRKSQSSYGWDWGPAFVTQGIWKNIEIESFNVAVLRYVSSATYKDKGMWMVNISVALDCPSRNCSGVLFVRQSELGIDVNYSVSLVDDVDNIVTIQVPASQAERWWPRGYGAAKLYTITIEFVDATWGETSTKTITTGFRTVELVEEAATNGLTFYFKINGLAIFMKGSNWIPGDAFQDRMTTERYKNLLQSAVDANMNTIRVWGGGIYEDETFYTLTDKLGLMVWQDLMFACSMYPTDGAYLENVRREIHQQITRLQTHPSVIAWTANNENEVALVDNWYGTSVNYPKYKSDYVKLYLETIRSTVKSVDQSIPFLSSSPSNGKESEKQNGVSETPRPSDPHYGDIHYYRYEDDCWDHTKYQPTRFASEYGVQSWPSFETLKAVSEAQDWDMTSDFVEHRQHKLEAGNGTDQMIRRHFRLPTSTNTITKFKDYIYLTQINQALCYKYQTEFYRRNMGNADVKTMGALYWQLNDIWQAPSWSSIEYGGKWKMLHYYAKRFFHDPITSAYVENGTMYMYVISGLNQEIQEVLLVLKTWKWDNMASVHRESFIIPSIARQSATMVVSRKISDMGCSDVTKCFATLELEKEGKTLAPLNPHWLTSFNKAVGMKHANLKITSVQQRAQNLFDVTITSDAIAPFTWLEHNSIEGRFSDNGFLVIAANTTVQFHAWETVTTEQLRQAVRVTSLLDIYRN